MIQKSLDSERIDILEYLRPKSLTSNLSLHFQVNKPCGLRITSYLIGKETTSMEYLKSCSSPSSNMCHSFPYLGIILSFILIIMTLPIYHQILLNRAIHNRVNHHAIQYSLEAWESKYMIELQCLVIQHTIVLCVSIDLYSSPWITALFLYDFHVHPLILSDSITVFQPWSGNRQSIWKGNLCIGPRG